MSLLDYVPSILAFAFAVLALVGKTTDDKRHGIRKVTTIGWVVLSLSIFSLGLGLFTIYSKHIALDKRAAVAELTRARLTQGIALMLRPFCRVDELNSKLEIPRLFAVMRSDANLKAVGKARTVKWPGMGGRVVAGSKLLPYEMFDEVYQLLDFYIAEGERMTKETLSSFGGYLSEDEIITLSTLLSDGFLNGEYRLSGKLDYFQQGLKDEKRTGSPSPWNTVGLHYFNAIYEGPSARSGNTKPAVDFLRKAEAAVDLIANKRSQPVHLITCSRLGE